MSSRKRRSTVQPMSESSSSTLEFREYPFSRRPRRVVSRYSDANASSSFTSRYIDNGDCNLVCEFCGSFFWFDERCISRSINCRPKYTQCCKLGRVVLPYPKKPSPDVVCLFEQRDFLANIRAYNSMFSMTSFGAKVDEKINYGSGPYVFKIQGQIYHWLGSMCPPPNERPRFLQMYIYDTEHEVSNRLSVYSEGTQSRLCPSVVGFLISYLEKSNELVKLFRTARDICTTTDVPDFRICLYASHHALCYDKPSSGSIGAILLDGDSSCTNFDIVIRHRREGAQRINKLHPMYMALQYPLLFLNGESGWSPDMTLRVVPSEKDETYC